MEYKEQMKLYKEDVNTGIKQMENELTFLDEEINFLKKKKTYVNGQLKSSKKIMKNINKQIA
jgi:hypothetical protein